MHACAFKQTYVAKYTYTIDIERAHTSFLHNDYTNTYVCILLYISVHYSACNSLVEKTAHIKTGIKKQFMDIKTETCKTNFAYVGTFHKVMHIYKYTVHECNMKLTYTYVYTIYCMALNSANMLKN